MEDSISGIRRASFPEAEYYCRSQNRIRGSTKAIVRYLRLGTVVAAEMGVIRYITAAFRTPFDSVNTKSLTPLRINGKGAVKKLVNFRRFVGFRWGHWVRRHIRGGKEHKSPPFQSDQDIFLKREILSKATFNFFRPLTLSRLKFRFLSHLSSTFGSRPDKFIDAGLNLLIGFASRNGEDLFLEFVPLENHLLSSFPVRSNSIWCLRTT